MRIRIELFGDSAVILGKGYNEYLQAVVYNHLDGKEAHWLHEKGKSDKEKKSFPSHSIKAKAISPIEVHSTLSKGDGKKKTYYYTPFEKEFTELINPNIKKKWKAFHKESNETHGRASLRESVRKRTGIDETRGVT